MMGQWCPDLFDYPFRFEGPEVGDPVFVIIRHRETKEFKIFEDKIAEVTDNYDTAMATNAGEWFVDEKTGGYALAKDHGQAGDRSNYLIDYWLDQFNPGYGLTYGDVLFETAESAQEILDDIIANLDKWDGINDSE